MNHFLRFHNISLLPNTKDDFQKFSILVALRPEIKVTPLPRSSLIALAMVRTFCVIIIKPLPAYPPSPIKSITRNNKIKQKRVGNQSQILED